MDTQKATLATYQANKQAQAKQASVNSIKTLFADAEKASESVARLLSRALVLGAMHGKEYGSYSYCSECLDKMEVLLPGSEKQRKEAILKARDWLAAHTPHTFYIKNGRYQATPKDKAKQVALIDSSAIPLDYYDAELDATRKEKAANRKQAAEQRQTAKVDLKAELEQSRSNNRVLVDRTTRLDRELETLRNDTAVVIRTERSKLVAYKEQVKAERNKAAALLRKQRATIRALKAALAAMAALSAPITATVQEIEVIESKPRRTRKAA